MLLNKATLNVPDTHTSHDGIQVPSPTELSLTGQYDFPRERYNELRERDARQRALSLTEDLTRESIEEDADLVELGQLNSIADARRQTQLEDLRTALEHGPDLDEDVHVCRESGHAVQPGICHNLRSHSLGTTSSPHSSNQTTSIPKPPLSEHTRVSKLATELYTVSYLIFFSLLGTLARLGLQALTFYPGAPVQVGVLWANFTGSLILGFLLEDHKLFSEEWGNPTLVQERRQGDEEGHPQSCYDNTEALNAMAAEEQVAAKKVIPLYIGLATGFCGSFTSFSSFIRDAFLALSNTLPDPTITPAPPVARNPGYGFLAVLAVIIITTILSLGALQLGSHIARALDRITPSIPYLFTRKVLDRAVVLLAWFAWLAAIILTIWPSPHHSTWRGQVLFALAFAPPGCLLRFYVSRHLNGVLPWFPVGTFTVNMLGTALEGAFFDLQHVPLGGRVGCQALQGAMDGFCGCFTTVSTWVAELKGLRKGRAYVYGGTSVGAGLSLMIIVVGSLLWRDGFGEVICVH